MSDVLAQRLKYRECRSTDISLLDTVDDQSGKSDPIRGIRSGRSNGIITTKKDESKQLLAHRAIARLHHNWHGSRRDYRSSANLTVWQTLACYKPDARWNQNIEQPNYFIEHPFPELPCISTKEKGSNCT